VAVFPRLGTISGGATKLLNSDTGGGSSDDDDDDDDEADFFFVGITDIITTYYRTASSHFSFGRQESLDFCAISVVSLYCVPSSFSLTHTICFE
jgi:hypothetical protein